MANRRVCAMLATQIVSTADVANKSRAMAGPWSKPASFET